MSKKMYEEISIAAIAEKIREYTGKQTLYLVSEMPNGVEEVAVVGYLSGRAGFDDLSIRIDGIEEEQITQNEDILKNAQSISDINSSKGVSNGIATLDENGHILSTQLPASVDSVVEGYISADKKTFYGDELHILPITPESSKIYIDLVYLKSYRWGGTIFAEISESLVLGETANTAYYGDKGSEAYKHSLKQSGNPHNVTAADVQALPLSGGTLKGGVTIAQGDGNGIQLGKRGYINATSGDKKDCTMLGVNETGNALFGHQAFVMNLRGSEPRPVYNGNNVALYSDLSGYLPLSGGILTDTLYIKQDGVGIQLGPLGNICATDVHDGKGTTRTVLGTGIHWATDASKEDETTVGHPSFHLALRGSKKRPTYCDGSNKSNNTELARLDDVPSKTKILRFTYDDGTTDDIEVFVK